MFDKVSKFWSSGKGGPQLKLCETSFYELKVIVVPPLRWTRNFDSKLIVLIKEMVFNNFQKV